MDDHVLNLIKITGFTCLMVVLPLCVGLIAVRILERPWRVTRWKKIQWSIERKWKGKS